MRLYICKQIDVSTYINIIRRNNYPVLTLYGLHNIRSTFKGFWII